MKNRILIIVLLIIFIGKIFSQETTYKKNTISFTPLKLTGLINPSVELAYERKINNNFSLQGTYGFIVLHKNEKGFTSAVESRFYIPDAENNLYFSVEMGYISKKSNVSWDIENPQYNADYFPGDSNYVPETYIDNFTVNYSQLYLVPKIGIKKMLSKNFSLDMYIGIGAKYTKISHSNRINPDDKLEKPYDSFIQFEESLKYNTYEKSEHIKPRLLFNVRIGYTF